MSTSQTDEEKGARPNGERPSPSRAASLMNMAQRLFEGRKLEDRDEDFSHEISPERLDVTAPPVSARGRLAIYRRLTGIDSGVPHLRLNRPARNQGIYQHAVDEEKAAKRNYVFFSRLINGCLGLQIIVAAALTALGAGDGPHAIVTVFGAINTVTAGFLTYLKGSGLPNRSKFFHNEWSRLREHIEQRERDFGREDCELDINKEVEIVERMYKEVRAEIEANTPDGYKSMTRARDKTLHVTHMPSSKPIDSTGGVSETFKSEKSGTTGLGVDKEEGSRITHV